MTISAIEKHKADRGKWNRVWLEVKHRGQGCSEKVARNENLKWVRK